jgi:DME family drug/metabolite transporter
MTMIGAGVALMTALAWAGSSALIKFLTAQIDTVSLNTLRLWIGSIILLAFVFLSGRGDAFMHTPLKPLLFLGASGLIAIAVGDTIYIKSLTFIDVSRAFPIGQCTFPVLTMFVAIFLLEEPFSWFNMLGGFLVLMGLYMVAILGKRTATSPASARNDTRGVLLALAAALAWTAGAIALKLGVPETDAFIAAAIRISVSAIALTGLVLCRNRPWALPFNKYGLRNIMMAAATAVLTYGIAAVGYVSAMQLIGVGKTVLITAVAPIFLLPLSILLLRERPTLHAVIGVAVCVSGVVLVCMV